jgi:hypothetical protein
MCFNRELINRKTVERSLNISNSHSHVKNKSTSRHGHAEIINVKQEHTVVKIILCCIITLLFFHNFSKYVSLITISF